MTWLAFPVALAFVVFVVLAYWRGWRWSGLPEVRRTRGGDEDVQPAKTLWDWLQLLVIPLALAVLAFVLNEAQTEREQRREDDRAKQQEATATDAARENTLRAYLTQMSELTLDPELLRSKPRSDVQAVARTATLTAVRRLDGERRGIAVQFLDEARLLRRGAVKVDMPGADLRDATLRNASLADDDLSGADLRGADLQGADLQGANLQAANLQGANLQGANLRRANLRRSDLQGVNLRGANLQETNVRDANLQDADLGGAGPRRPGPRRAASRRVSQRVTHLGADLRDADLSFADLLLADLRRVNLRRANLQDANLRRTDLRDADLRDATVSELRYAKRNRRLLIRVDALHIDTLARTVDVNGSTVDLGRKEFDILSTLASHPTMVFSKDELLRRVRNYMTPQPSSSTVDRHVTRLRRHLQEAGAELIHDRGDAGWSLTKR